MRASNATPCFCVFCGGATLVNFSIMLFCVGKCFQKCIFLKHLRQAIVAARRQGRGMGMKSVGREKWEVVDVLNYSIAGPEGGRRLSMASCDS
jgi:hypothetical protein